MQECHREPQVVEMRYGRHTGMDFGGRAESARRRQSDICSVRRVCGPEMVLRYQRPAYGRMH